MKTLSLILILSVSMTLCNAQVKLSKKMQEKTELIKFEPGVSFSDFKVKVEKVNTKPDLKSHELGHRFRSAIRNDYANVESKFAGHYSLAYWGCGSPCKISVLIDRRNGKIYDAPTSSVGYEFQNDSRMLIVNPPDSIGYYDKNCFYCEPEIYILNEKTKKFELKK